MFTPAEVQEVVDIGYLNGLFVLARSIGLIGGRPGRAAGWRLAGLLGATLHGLLPGRVCGKVAGVGAAGTACVACLPVLHLWCDSSTSPCAPTSPSPAGHALDQKRLQQPLFR